MNKMTINAFHALPVHEREAYRRFLAEQDIRRAYDNGGHVLHPTLGATASSGTPQYRASGKTQKALCEEMRESVMAAVDAERTALGIPPGARTTTVFYSVAKRGKRYAWAISDSDIEGGYPHPLFGEAETEDEAWRCAEDNARAMVAYFAGQPVRHCGEHLGGAGVYLFEVAPVGAYLAAKAASDAAREKRRAKPGKGGKGAETVRYLIIEGRRHRIVRETAKQVRFLLNPERDEDEGEGAIFRTRGEDATGLIRKEKYAEELKRFGCGYYNAPGFYYAEVWLTEEAYAAYQAAAAAKAEDSGKTLAELKRAMVEAHPDKGGTNEAFIAARKAYEAVRIRR